MTLTVFQYVRITRHPAGVPCSPVSTVRSVTAWPQNRCWQHKYFRITATLAHHYSYLNLYVPSTQRNNSHLPDDYRSLQTLL